MHLEKLLVLYQTCQKLSRVVMYFSKSFLKTTNFGATEVFRVSNDDGRRVVAAAGD